MTPRVRTAFALACIVVIGLALRLYHLGAVPFGLHTDEGHNTLDALRIIDGARPVFLDRNNGREPLFMYLMAALMAVFGPTIWAARLTGAVSGTLVILGQFVFARSLPYARPRRVALLSAAFVAVTFWPVAQSRYALRAGLLPFWIALMLWAWWKTLQGDGRRYAVWTGVFLAAAVYTHLTGRLLPVALGFSAWWVLARERRPRVLSDLAIAFVVALVLALPQIHYFYTHPEMLSYRSDQVSAFNPDVNEGDLSGILAENAWNLVKAPVWAGDASWYHNLKRRPVFGDPLSALALVAGAVLLGLHLLGRRGRKRQTAAVLLVATLAVTLLPSWLSVGAPNYVRLTGTWPVLFLLPALGLDRLALAVERWVRPGWGAWRAWAGALIGLTLGWTLFGTVYDYFWRYAPRDEVYAAFNGAAVERGLVLREVVAQGPTYVSPVLWQQSVIRFLNAQDPPRSFDMRAGLVAPEDSGPVHYAFDVVEREDADRFGGRWPDAKRQELRDGRGETSLIAFELPGNAMDASRLTRGPMGLSGFPRVFGDRIRLSWLRVEPYTVAPGDTVSVTLWWQAISPTVTDVNFFVHLVSKTDARTIGQFDGSPLEGSYTTDQWRPGERVFQSIAIQIPADAPDGWAAVEVGWYDWRDGKRLPVDGDDDAAVEVGAVQVVRAP